ncbi:hypothetical protein EDB80DRAFT_783650 [Ilyonectria destructans]|nr:hypothetical protein EDB80DRAFT_783650 [Ilyonectria destructans]
MNTKHSLFMQYNTPLIGALHPEFHFRDDRTQGEVDTQIRIVKFLIANGATASCGSEKLTGELSLEIFSWVIRAWPGSAHYALAKLLLDEGAISLKHPIDTTRLDGLNTFSLAAQDDNVELLKLLATEILPFCGLEYPVSAFVKVPYLEGGGAVKEVLMKPPFYRSDSLLYLVREFMYQKSDEDSWSPLLLVDEFLFGNDDGSLMTWREFSNAVAMLVENGSDPLNEEYITYKRRRYTSTNSREHELISPLKLVEKIVTSKSRSRARKVLQDNMPEWRRQQMKFTRTCEKRNVSNVSNVRERERERERERAMLIMLRPGRAGRA